MPIGGGPIYRTASLKTSLICGVSGQDGAHLARLLLRRDDRVIGTSCDAQITDFRNLLRLRIREQVTVESMVLTDFRSTLQTPAKVAPDEVYNLAGQSSVGLSFQQPVETLESIATGTLNLLEAIRFLGGPIRLYNAGSGECFGNTGEVSADESTPFVPAVPMLSLKRLPSGKSPTSEMPMGCLPATASSSITKPPCVLNASSHAILSALPTALPAKVRKSYAWAISPCLVTGGGRRSTSKPCGGCSNAKNRMTSSSLRASPIPWRNSSPSPSRKTASTGATMASRILTCCALPRSPTTEATRARPRRFSAGRRSCACQRWFGAWSRLSGRVCIFRLEYLYGLNVLRHEGMPSSFQGREMRGSEVPGRLAKTGTRTMQPRVPI